MSLGQSNVKSPESSGKWSVFADPEISVLADKVFVHVLRYLISLICMYISISISISIYIYIYIYICIYTCIQF